jgi:hypothetical protein
VYLDDLLGRRVVAQDGRSAGRIEEVRAERRGDEYEIVEFLLGTGALLERFAIARRFRTPKMRVARWDQVDLDSPATPRLRCPIEALAER